MLEDFSKVSDSEKNETSAKNQNVLSELATSMLRSPGPKNNVESKPRMQGSVGHAEAVPQPDSNRDHFRFMDPTPTRKTKYNPENRTRAECPDAGPVQETKIGAAERRRRALAYTEELQRWQRERLRGLGKPAKRGVVGDV